MHVSERRGRREKGEWMVNVMIYSTELLVTILRLAGYTHYVCGGDRRYASSRYALSRYALSLVALSIRSTCPPHPKPLTNPLRQNDNSTDTTSTLLTTLLSLPLPPSRTLTLAPPVPSQLYAGGSRNHCIRHATTSILVLLDADDLMYPNRVAVSVRTLLKASHNAIVGTTFHRWPENSTEHYTTWCNTLSSDRLLLEQYRELTIIQPSWTLYRTHFEECGGYAEVDGSAGFSRDALFLKARDVSDDDFKVAEDLRFWHAHLHKGGTVVRVCDDDGSPLTMYRHVEGLSQSSRTPRKLLMRLRVRAFEVRVLGGWKDGFVIWGAGRDGKDVFKMLGESERKMVRGFVDVDEKKIKAGFYVNRDLQCKVPIKSFEALKEGGEWGHYPVMVCVAMYRTGGKLEENVGSVGRTEGEDLWHFC